MGELTIAGGSVNINSNGSVNLSTGSTVNVSGGSIDYAGAEVQTTNLIGANGEIVNIAQANPNKVYSGIYTGSTTTDSKWNVSTTNSPSLQQNQTYDPGYVQGGAGGTLSIDAPSASLNGSLYGNTTQGTRQQTSPPVASSFNLDIQAATANTNPPAVNVVIQAPTDPVSNNSTTLDLSSDLFGIDGFGNATINTGSGQITVAPDAVLVTNPGGKLNFTAANVEIDGQIIDPSGVVSLTALAKRRSIFPRESRPPTTPRSEISP